MAKITVALSAGTNNPMRYGKSVAGDWWIIRLLESQTGGASADPPGDSKTDP